MANRSRNMKLYEFMNYELRNREKLRSLEMMTR
jgi:hypothetical protein